MPGMRISATITANGPSRASCSSAAEPLLAVASWNRLRRFRV